ncbi:tryptophan 7-halogenase [Streptomyces sp. NPDC049555]|uniref:tryptophan 7-halogenase n=1 Tax=Streptomyces sp. NPDC049555 TaxID=3154930 RepID=UPI003417606B
MGDLIENVVVAGGGRDAWTAAVRLAGALGGTVRITVLDPAPGPGPAGIEAIEAARLAPGVQQALFDGTGVLEREWMRACDASFDVATRYVNWRTPHAASAVPHMLASGWADQFYRPYAEMPLCEDVPLIDHWRTRRHHGETLEPFDYACFREPPLMDARKSPRWLDGRAALPYGWHADAHLFTAFLRKLATRTLGVRRITGVPQSAERDAQGMLTALHTTDGLRVEGDFFLDCTGEQRLLMSGILDEPFVPAQDALLCDSAVVVTTPHDPAAGIEPYTTLVAVPEGWAWRTPLAGRVVTGLVHAGDLTGPDRAARRLCALWGPDPARATVRHVRLATGRSHRSWVRNCVALGAASYALEPLPGAGPADVLGAVDLLVRDFPAMAGREAPAARFEQALAERFARARDLARLHYAAGPRTDAPLWRAQQALPPSAALAGSTAAYRAGLTPAPDDLPYHALLAAAAASRPAPCPPLAHRPDSRRAAQEHFSRVRRQQRILLETLPSADAYLRRLHGLPSRQFPLLHEAATMLGSGGGFALA